MRINFSLVLSRASIALLSGTAIDVLGRGRLYIYKYHEKIQGMAHLAHNILSAAETDDVNDVNVEGILNNSRVNSMNSRWSIVIKSHAAF